MKVQIDLGLWRRIIRQSPGILPRILTRYSLWLASGACPWRLVYLVTYVEIFCLFQIFRDMSSRTVSRTDLADKISDQTFHKRLIYTCIKLVG